MSTQATSALSEHTRAEIDHWVAKFPPGRARSATSSRRWETPSLMRGRSRSPRRRHRKTRGRRRKARNKTRRIILLLRLRPRRKRLLRPPRLVSRKSAPLPRRRKIGNQSGIFLMPSRSRTSRALSRARTHRSPDMWMSAVSPAAPKSKIRIQEKSF